MKFHDQISEISYAWWDRYYPVTKADREIDTFLRTWLGKISNTQILSQEHEQKRVDYSWDVRMVDAIDGTKDFIWWSWLFSHMIWLCRAGRPILWAVYLPFFDQLYSAEKWKGSFLIEKKGSPRKLSVSTIDTLVDSRCLWKSEFSEKRDIFDHIQKSLWGKKLLVGWTIWKMLWDIADWVADIYFFTNPRWAKRDTCGVQVILEEAWWMITDRYWNSINYDSEGYLLENLFVATNWYLHDNALEIFSKIE